jgi:hypothetical protein
MCYRTSWAGVTPYFASELLNRRLLKQPRTAALRAPALRHYSEFVVYSPKVCLREERVHLNLIDGGHHTGRIDDHAQMLGGEVRDPDRSQQAPACISISAFQVSTKRASRGSGSSSCSVESSGQRARRLLEMIDQLES